ncbi:hypothetical protein TWF703_010487 [Orbilia oligospora]|uniref:Protein kinase domain-containing protein n=1 Tax=Orbilia oligospora TaxID=2813651 RepID=A0A7C8JQC0_ORBOL|nr:hypothetical protein TWF703_010487 [Orbilia oligospora]
MDISFFKYGERLCLIYPRALGTLEHLLTEGLACPTSNITSLNLWRQLKQVSEGIDFIHKSLKTQHLDLKPSNILIFEEHGSSDRNIGKGGGPASPLSTSSTRSPLSGNFTGDAIFMISDFGYQVPGSNPSAVAPGAGTWGPPEGPHTLSILSTNEANELYDHWSFGAILLEAAVYDRARGSDEESGTIDVKEFRYRRANLDKGSTSATTLKFYILGENGENGLRCTVSEQIANMEMLQDYKLDESQDCYTRMPAKFYRDIAGDIIRLLSISPKKRRSEKGMMSIDPYEYYYYVVQRTTTVPFTSLNSQPVPILPSSGRLQIESNDSSVTIPDEPARSLDLNRRETLWDSKREFELQIWKDRTGKEEVVWMSETPHGQDSGSTRTHPSSYPVQDISLPGADSRGPWTITSLKGSGLREWSFANKDGENFFHWVSGIELFAGNGTNLTSRTSQTSRTSRTDISRSKLKPNKLVTRNRAWLWVVPNHLEGSADKHPDGYLLDITDSVSHRQHGEKVELNEERRPGKQAKIMKHPYMLGVPFQIENPDEVQPCRDISFRFASNERAKEFYDNFRRAKEYTTLQPPRRNTFR